MIHAPLKLTTKRGDALRNSHFLSQHRTMSSVATSPLPSTFDDTELPTSTAASSPPTQLTSLEVRLTNTGCGVMLNIHRTTSRMGQLLTKQ